MSHDDQLGEAAKRLPEDRQPKFHLIVNRTERTWTREEITGAEIKQLAASPSDWVVNQIVPGPGEDPEIGDDQKVHLDEKASPRGVKRFTTRKPATNPGAPQ